MKIAAQQPLYGNWVSVSMIKKVFLCALALSAACAALWAFARGLFALKLAISAAALFFAACAVYFLRARRLFSPEGGDVQNQVVALVLSRAEWDGYGRALDIGCGGGALAIRLAKLYENALVTGADLWGKGWDYSRELCEENARLERVADRMDFVRASASKLPFADGSFELVVSNLTFHEVRDCKDKFECLGEALRVLKSGGRFVLQDLFLVRSFYGAPEKLVEAIEAMGARGVVFEDTSKSPFIPRLLRLPFMIGAIGIVRGEKA